MGGREDGRSGGRFLRIMASAVLLAAHPPGRVCAQLGYDPSHSPFHDIRRGAVLVVTGGYFAGDRGRVGVGISNGPTGGLRYEAGLAGVIGVSLGVAYGQTTRFVVDPTKDTASRQSGPFDNHVVLADAALQLLLTGNKTWRGFAPYIGAAIGVALDGGSPPDPSGYNFGTKITLAPSVGVRWYPARRLSVRTDFRAVAWKLHYPLSYRVPDAVDRVPVLPVTVSLDNWTWHPWLAIGAGWTF